MPTTRQNTVQTIIMTTAKKQLQLFYYSYWCTHWHFDRNIN